MFLSISICTRNRAENLIKAFKSIVISWENLEKDTCENSLELLIIDDGELNNNILKGFHKICEIHKINFVYHKKNNKGLYNSRIETIKVAKGEIIIFLDDDIELEKKYLKFLIDSFQNELIGGFGGVEQNISAPSKRLLLYQRIFLHSNKLPGFLSITGFNGSITKWSLQSKPFKSNFLSGSNMSFRKELLLDLPNETIFLGYSVGEDIFISQFVSKKAKIIVNPLAKLKHNHASQSRDRILQVSRSTIENYFFMFTWFEYPQNLYVLFLWSSFGFLVKAIYDFLKKMIKVNDFKSIIEQFSAISGYTLGIIKIIFKN